MKKFLLLMFVFVSGLTQAQSLGFGIKGGGNFSNLGGDNIDTSTLASYYLGAFVELSLFENLSIQPEILYSSQGAKVKDADDIKLDYINVPVLAKFYLTSKTFSIEAGPQFGLLLSDNVENTFETETFDFSVVGGICYNLTDSISAHARYVAGLTEASKNAELTNSVIQIGIGYKF